MGSEIDNDYESFAAFVADAIAAFAENKTRTTRAEDEDRHRLRQAVVMREIDGSEGEHSPPRVKRTPHVSLAPPTRLDLCALRCSGAANSYIRVNVSERSSLLITREKFVQKQYQILISFHFLGLSIRFCPPGSSTRKSISSLDSDTLFNLESGSVAV